MIVIEYEVLFDGRNKCLAGSVAVRRYGVQHAAWTELYTLGTATCQLDAASPLKPLEVGHVQLT